MRYLGSKTLLLEQIRGLICEYPIGVFCDPFGGIGTVGSYMKNCGYQVITGDILRFAHYFQVALIEYDKIPDFLGIRKLVGLHSNEELEQYLSEISTDSGWLVEEYARKRKFFTIENAKHIQACIDTIIQWKTYGYTEEREHMFLIASLINSFDKVANTAGTYYAYLKKYDRKALKSFRFEFLAPSEGLQGRAEFMNANELVRNTVCDVLYLDPPYNERNYARYYHLPETVAYGIEPNPKGKSGMFQYREVFSQYNGKLAEDAFSDLIACAKAKCILFHYTDNGLIHTERAKAILQSKGRRFEEFYFDCKGYHTTKMQGKIQHHIMKVCL